MAPRLGPHFFITNRGKRTFRLGLSPYTTATMKTATQTILDSERSSSEQRVTQATADAASGSTTTDNSGTIVVKTTREELRALAFEIYVRRLTVKMLRETLVIQNSHFRFFCHPPES